MKYKISFFYFSADRHTHRGFYIIIHYIFSVFIVFFLKDIQRTLGGHTHRQHFFDASFKKKVKIIALANCGIFFFKKERKNFKKEIDFLIDTHKNEEKGLEYANLKYKHRAL